MIDLKSSNIAAEDGFCTYILPLLYVYVYVHDFDVVLSCGVGFDGFIAHPVKDGLEQKI